MTRMNIGNTVYFSISTKSMPMVRHAQTLSASHWTELKSFFGMCPCFSLSQPNCKLKSTGHQKNNNKMVYMREGGYAKRWEYIWFKFRSGFDRCCFCCCCCCFFSVVFVLFGGWFLVFSHQRHKDYVNSLRMSTHYKSDFYTNIYCFYFPMDFVRLDAEQCALAYTHTGTRTHPQHTCSILYVINKIARC